MKKSKGDKPEKTKKKKVTTQSLAVKYRPRVIDDLVGQETVSTQVRGMVKLGRFPTTIGLLGESGAGKTTTARMIARYVNCHKPDKATGQPCNECVSCQFETNHPDVHEANMATERGIDDARAMVASARSMPTIGNKRIFILDEIHAATPQALQALLKPLEEPSEDTVWILCTTNPEKLPAAVLGRMHRFTIKPIAPEAIAKRLRIIGKKEGVDFKEMEGGKEVISTIANLSNGRMRDAITQLESVLFAIASGDKIDSKTLIKNYATSGDADLDKMAAHLVFGLVSCNSKIALTSIIDAKNARGQINKARWLLQGIVAQSLSRDFFKTYTWRLFHELIAKEKIQPRLSVILQIQALLCDIEIQLNSVSIDETVLFTSRVGAHLAANRPTKKEE